MKGLYFIAVLSIVFCGVAEAGVPTSERDGIDAEFSQTPLISAIELLSAISGTPISIDGRHANPPITARLSNKSLDEALSTVLRQVSHMIIRQSNGAYSVLILEGDGAQAEAAPQRVASVSSAPMPLGLGLGLGEAELFPGRDGLPGPTQQDLDYYADTSLPRDASKIEVIPPVDGISAGVTLQELRAFGDSAEADVAAVVADIDTIPGEFN